MHSHSDLSNFNIIQSWKYYNDSQPPTRTTSQEDERIRDRDYRDGCRDRYRERERERERDLELENNMKRGGWDELKRKYKQHCSSSFYCIVLPVSALLFRMVLLSLPNHFCTVHTSLTLICIPNDHLLSLFFTFTTTFFLIYSSFSLILAY